MMEEIDAGTNFVTELKALGPTPPIYMLSSMGDNLAVTTRLHRTSASTASSKNRSTTNACCQSSKRNWVRSATRNRSACGNFV
jgi:hypothetical protein